MTYEFKCVNIQCKCRNEIIEKEMPMHDSGKPQYCKCCNESLQKVFGSPSIKTGDGYKG